MVTLAWTSRSGWLSPPRCCNPIGTRWAGPTGRFWVCRACSSVPAELLVPYPAEEMTAWRVADDAKNSRIEPHPGMTEPVVPNG